MSTIVIRPPNLKKLQNEQNQILASLPYTPSPKSLYLTASLPPLTSVYHSRGCTPAIEAPTSQWRASCSKEEEELPLLSDLLNSASRVNLDVEKTLSLACQVLEKARKQSPELSEEVRLSLDTISRISSSSFAATAALLPPEE